jgi:hypothetical protein
MTVTVKLAVAVLPCVSDAVHVTLVVPSANVEPDGTLQVSGRGPSTRSVALAANVTTAPFGPVASALILGGTVSAGGVVSTTETVKVALDALLWASVAVQITVVFPIGNVEPEAGVQRAVIQAFDVAVQEAEEEQSI